MVKNDWLLLRGFSVQLIDGNCMQDCRVTDHAEVQAIAFNHQVHLFVVVGTEKQGELSCRAYNHTVAYALDQRISPAVQNVLYRVEIRSIENFKNKDLYSELFQWNDPSLITFMAQCFNLNL